MSLIDNVATNLSNGFHDTALQQNIITMCNTLKQCAHQFEAVYKGNSANILSYHF